MSMSHRDSYAQKTQQMRASKRRLLELLSRLDNNRGCFARRATIAEMIKYSIHTVNCDISALKRSGFLTTESAGQRRDSPSIIRLTPRGRAVLRRILKETLQHHPKSSKNFTHERLQGEYKQSRVHDKEYHVQKTGTIQHSTHSSVHDQSKPGHVVDKPQLTEEERKIYNRLCHLGIDNKKAQKLSKNCAIEEINRAEKIAKRYRGEIWNYPGFIISAVKQGWGEKPRVHERAEDFLIPARQWANENRGRDENPRPLSESRAHNTHEKAYIPSGEKLTGTSEVKKNQSSPAKKKVKELPVWKDRPEDYGEPAAQGYAVNALAKIRDMFSSEKNIP